RAPVRPQGFAEYRVAERRIPRLRGSYGDAGLRARLGTPHYRPAAAHRDHVRRSRAVALPPPAHRRRADRARHRRAAHPRGGGGARPRAVAPRPRARRRAPPLSRTTRPAVALVTAAGPSRP